MGRSVLVIGAGATGLAAAWFLAKNGVTVDLIEMETRIGGQAATIKLGDDLYADLAPHVFHGMDSEVTSLVEDLMGHALRRIRSDAQMRVTGKLFDYPLNVPNLLEGLSPVLSMRIIWDYAKANLKDKILRLPERSFEDLCIKRFGRTLSDLCFLHYTRKVWGRDPTELSCVLAQQKLARLNLRDLFVKLIGFRGQEQPVYFREFYYPEYGIGELWDTLAADLQKHGGRIHLNSALDHIEMKDGRAISAHIQGGSSAVYRNPWIISTVPITVLLDALGSAMPRSVRIAASSLKFRSLILLYLIVRRDRVLRPQWIYFLDDEFTFNRISEQKAMSEKMVPRGKTVLCVEKNCDFNDSIWNASAEQHFAKAMEELEEANLVSRKEVEGYDVAKVRYAYPVFEVDFQNRLDSVMRYLAGVERLITVGRSGLYLNNDMHDSMEMGLMAGRYVLRCLNQEQTSRPWYEEVSAYKYAKGW